ncbi:hypothetical protein V8G54_028293 [Vigna mungo]|uniref:Retrovirus-related Pol polyprotein from transposon TNT 1-94-like beta-barrel domain-containing protein n=1 Tax=Vigna mungo TaxID=3915 RepID=A0AAQ3MRY1_VIGMU
MLSLLRGFVTSILSRREPYTVEEIKAFAQEERLEKNLNTDLVPQVNVTTSSWHNSSRRSSLVNLGHINNLLLKLTIEFNAKFVPSSVIMLLNAGKDSIKIFSLRFSFTTSSIDIYDQLSNIFSLPDPLWYPDSGASHHVTNDSSNFNSKSSYTGSEKIKLGNGAGLKITQIGSPALSTSSSSSSFVLNNLLHVPTWQRVENSQVEAEEEEAAPYCSSRQSLEVDTELFIGLLI